MKLNRFNSAKILCHGEKLQYIAEGGIPNPVQWVVYPSYNCPYACPHCIMAEEKQSVGVSTRLKEATMLKIPEDAEKYGIKTVIFSGGGEPLTHPLTLTVLAELKQRGIKTGLNTNGYFLTDATDIDYLRVSFDAATGRTYDRVHGADAFERVSENLMKFKRNPSGDFGLAYLVTPDNINEAPIFPYLAEKFKPDFIHIRPAFLDYDFLKDGKKLRKLMESSKDALEMIGDLFDNVYVKTDKFNGHWTEKEYNKCRATPLMAVTCADGSFAVCQDVFIKWGDYNNQSFSDIWGSKEHREAIEKIDISKCPRCVEGAYNRIIEACYLRDDLRKDLI